MQSGAKPEMKCAVSPVIHVVGYQTSDRGIGFENRLVYRLDHDMVHFRQITTGSIVIMGRKTHESVGKRLPNRVNVVLTRDQAYQSSSKEAIVFHDIEKALKWCALEHPTLTIYVIGGAEIYTATMPFTNAVIATEISGHRKADTFYPELPDPFHLTDFEDRGQTYDRISCSEVEYCIKLYDRPPSGGD